MRFSVRLILVGLSVYVMGCSSREDEINAAMKKYDRLIQHMEDSIADLYMPNGALGSEAVGRDSIRKFLKSFVDVSVLENRSTTESIIFRGDTAVQSGPYIQVAAVKKDTFRLRGKFTSFWVRQNEWRIAKMITTPIK